MDPNNRGPEDHGHDGAGQAPRQRPPRDPLTPDFGQHAPAHARTVQLVSGDYLLTVNPVDGSEIELCPPVERPARPPKLTAAERAGSDRVARPPAPPGPALPELPLVGREEERERLVRLLARGRSVRVTGPGGSGRTRLLDTVAEDCADLAPDGVIRLSGFHRTAGELLQELFHAVHEAPRHRPERDELLEAVREIGAIVVLDDLEFGGAALDELLDAAPECAFLVSATPEVPAPSAESALEEVVLGGLDRAGGLELLRHAVGRPLTEDEAGWAGDLWFESEGLPLRFVQAGALLRQRDRLRAGADAFDEFGVFQEAPSDEPFDAAIADEIPLPSLAEGAAPAALLASRLSRSARATLRLAVALGGEVPHPAHLPALVGDTHADAALGELLNCALVSPVGVRYRLAAGVQTQLEAAGYADDVQDHALTAARHYTWWAGHPSVTPERVCAEADALLAALGPLAPAASRPGEDDEDNPAVRLARTAAPAFAAGLHWGAWERALRAGAEASRLAGEVAEQAYFHHELGILALCEGRLDRARAELEASIGLRGALADKRGTVSGRRALALVDDRTGNIPGVGPVSAGPVLGAGPGGEVPAARPEESAFPSGGVPAVLPQFPPLARPAAPAAPVAFPSTAGGPAPRRVPGGLRGLARRNLVAAGAGALLVAVLGTVVTLGATSSNDADNPAEPIGGNPSASQGVADGSLGADEPDRDGDGAADTGSATSRPTDPGPDGTYGTSDDPTPTGAATGSGAGGPSDAPSGTGPDDDPSGPASGAPSTTTKPPVSPRPSTSSKPPSPTEPETTDSSTPTQTPTETPTSAPTDTPTTTDSAGAPTQTSTSASAPASGPAGSPGSVEPVI
ncbi:ATP-binding protein [Streptomyces glaucescens]|uniref:ATPase AAA n=1 Tax=Streptomyces glaucescens TaxID=1907 RepID=A0A089XBF1_STRGA|nr:ATP-binding protein [Streptomyces glaucescens]AIS00574.1 hypothetical protein SGLAU_23125 [Streptomyces glaucescens]